MKTRKATVTVLTMLCLLDNQPGFAQPPTDGPSRLGIDPQALESIRATSRAVLNAKHSETRDPDLDAARADMEALRATVRKLVLPEAASASKGRITAGSDRGTRTGSVQWPSAELRAVRDRLRQRQGALAPAATMRTGHVEPAHRAALKAAVQRKTGELQAKVEELLAMGPTESEAKLIALHARLNRSMESESPRRKSPTIQAIGRHRPLPQE